MAGCFAVVVACSCRCAWLLRLVAMASGCSGRCGSTLWQATWFDRGGHCGVAVVVAVLAALLSVAVLLCWCSTWFGHLARLLGLAVVVTVAKLWWLLWRCVVTVAKLCGC